jgi:hypothetical protein
MNRLARGAGGLGFVLVLGALLYAWTDRNDGPTAGSADVVAELIARNVAARGGAGAWRAVSSLRLTGQMDVGHGMHVPYVLEQKHPRKMCLEFVFDEQAAVQCVDGDAGWKLVPFRGRTRPEPMTAEELREMAGSVDLEGLLFDSEARGHVVELVGQEPVLGRDAFKLRVTLPGGAVRWIYLDAETGLEVKLEAMRRLAGSERRVETFFSDWQETEGLLIPRRQETRMEGEDELHFLTVESVGVNPPLDDARFEKPSPASVGATAGARPGERRG